MSDGGKLLTDEQLAEHSRTVAAAPDSWYWSRRLLATVDALKAERDENLQRYRDELAKRLVGEVKFEAELALKDKVVELMREAHDNWCLPQGLKKKFFDALNDHDKVMAR